MLLENIRLNKNLLDFEITLLEAFQAQIFIALLTELISSTLFAHWNHFKFMGFMVSSCQTILKSLNKKSFIKLFSITQKKNYVSMTKLTQPKINIIVFNRHDWSIPFVHAPFEQKNLILKRKNHINNWILFGSKTKLFSLVISCYRLIYLPFIFELCSLVID